MRAADRNNKYNIHTSPELKRDRQREKERETGYIGAENSARVLSSKQLGIEANRRDLFDRLTNLVKREQIIPDRS